MSLRRTALAMAVPPRPRVLSHIPNKGQMLQRYDGWYASRTRGIRKPNSNSKETTWRPASLAMYGATK